MTYVVDFEKSADVGDARYYITRIAGQTSVLRQWLRGDRPDPCCSKETIAPDQIPKQLIGIYNTLRTGGMPVVA